MKRILWTILVCLILVPACFAETEYALQGDVRVYVENGLAGLEDDKGNALCEAKYTWIEAFLDRDYAVVHADGMMGVVSREGKEVVPCEWKMIELTSDGKTAFLKDGDHRRLVALDTGDAVSIPSGQATIGMQDERIIVYSYGKNGRPPFRSDVYNTNMELIFSADAKVSILQGGYHVAEYSDGSQALLDARGNTLFEDAKGFTIHENGLVTYHKEKYRHANAFEACIDIIGNALDRGLWKNSGAYRDRNCLEWALYRFGIVTQPRETIPTVGVFDGESILFEYNGEALALRENNTDYSGDLRPAGEGLYLMYVQKDGAEGWIYVDEKGRQAVPGMYEKGYSFVDGSAVVFCDGYYFLIDVNGEMVGEVKWPDWWIGNNSFELDIIYVVIDSEDPHFRLINRKGEYISDARYSWVAWSDRGYYYVIDQEDKRTVLDCEGEAIVEDIGKGYYLESHEYATGPWAVVDGLAYHIDTKTGRFSNEQGYSVVHHDSACLPDGKSYVVIDEKGNPVGPYHGQNAVVRSTLNMIEESGK